MKTIGIGVDIIDNSRIKLLLKNKNFIKRTFSRKEIFFSKKIKNKVNFFSKRFAAKEAFVKALGTGFRDNLNFKDIEILNNKLIYHSLFKFKQFLRNLFIIVTLQ